MAPKLLTILAVSASLILSACGDDSSTPATEFDASVVHQWMQLLHDRVKADRRPPMHAARIYAYGGIALYEAVVGGAPALRSLGGQLNQMPTMPAVGEGEHDWPTVASAAAAATAESLISSEESVQAIHSLQADQRSAREAAGVPDRILNRSSEYGARIAAALTAWAASDGFRDTRGRAFAPPTGPDKWVPTPSAFVAAPLEPYWGELRTLGIPASGVCAPPPPTSFSTNPGSEMVAQARDVYDTGRHLAAEQREIALFWADNVGETGTPAGHWVMIMNQLAAERQMNLVQAAEMVALVGVSFHDAFCVCWKAKYTYNLLRPVTYIQRHIDPAWLPLIETPPFPEYTSGHSTQSGAAAAVLTELLGTMPFTDRTHERRGLPARSFHSFDEAGREAAQSRLYGGIHYPMANKNGYQSGQCIGRTIIDRVVTRR